MSKKTTTELLARGSRRKKNGKAIMKQINDDGIDCSEIPELTTAAFKKFKPWRVPNKIMARIGSKEKIIWPVANQRKKKAIID